MQPRKFLLYMGIILVIFSWASHFGLGLTSTQSLFGTWWWLDATMAIIMLLLGVVALLTYRFFSSDQIHRYTLAIIGFIALGAVIGSFIFADRPQPNLGITNVEQPLEQVVLLILAVAALWVALMPEGPIFVKETGGQS